MTTPTTVPVRLQLRADTAANWTSVNPILLANELGRETDTGKIKIGNGTSTWTSLAYQAWATLPVAVNAGGTGQTSYTNGQLLIGNTTGNTLTKATLTAGSGVAITNGTGSITVAASGIANTNIAADAEIAVSKLQDGTARQLLQTAANGTDVEWASNIDIPGTLDVTGNAVFDANLTVQGDLTVNGTETIINTQTLTVEDKNIELGKITSPTDVTADGGGITLKGTTDKTINWIDATDAWTLSEHVDLATGKEYRINGAQVLTGTALGSGVTSSSLTSVGTISSGTWQGTAVGTAYGGTGQTTYTNGELLIGKTDGTLAKATLTAGTGVAVTNADGSITVAVDSTVVTTAQTGTVTSTMIADGTIVDADVNASAAIAGTKISPNFGSQNVVTTGTSTAASLIPTGSSVPSNGVYLPAANSVGISTNGAQRLLINANGNIGIGSGTDLANSDIHLARGAGAAAYTAFTGNNNTITGAGLLVGQSAGGESRLFQYGNNPITFYTQSLERLRLTGDGRLGLGTSSVRSQFHISGTGQTTANLTDAGSRGDMLRLSGIGATGGQGGAILFANNQSDAADSVGYAAIKGLLTNGASNTQGDIAFSTRNAATDSALTERVRITAAGAVGIGTTSPSELLHVAGDARVGANDTSVAELQVGAGATGNRIAVIDLVGDTTYDDFGLRIERGGTGPNTTSVIQHRGTGEFRLIANEASPLAFWTQSTERARIRADGMFEVKGAGTAGVSPAFSINGSAPANSAVVDSSGRLGLGTSSPGYTLDVQGGAARILHQGAASILEIGTGTTTNQFAILDLVGDATYSDYGLRIFRADTGANTISVITHRGTGDLTVTTEEAAAIAFKTTNFERARIDSSGRLLVGTASDSGGALLQVNGNRIRIATANTPASASATGTTGEIAWDADYIYVCTATNTWKRTAISTW
jgi:hypothetical protein